MKRKNLYLVALLLLTSCQNELYKDALEDFKSDQGAYIANNGVIQTFVEENRTVEVKGVKVGLTLQEERELSVELEVGNPNQLENYNSQNGTDYIMLPKEMYEVPSRLTFESKYTMLDVPILLKNVKFSLEGNYALPIRIKNGDVGTIRSQNETLLVLEQRINTKVLRISTNENGSGSENGTMFPNDFKVDQWTMEVMIKRNHYSSNNKSICGTKQAPNDDPKNEIFVRYGDVTINPNQLQIKTGAAQIDVPADKHSAQADTWYMLTFVYDGKKNYVYVNGDLVADREIRTGAYGLTGFWIGGANDWIREVRFWTIARTPQEIAANVWKMVNPEDDNLLLYYPLNGKKRDFSTGLITEDETKLWDWSRNGKHLDMNSGYVFDDNNGENFLFPLP